MFAEKRKNSLKVVLDSEESFNFRIFEIIINPSSALSQEILSSLFLSACEKVNYNCKNGNYQVEISAQKGGNITVLFTKITEAVKVSRVLSLFEFLSVDDMLFCIKTLYHLKRVNAALYFYKNKYYLYIKHNKSINYIVKEFGRKVPKKTITALIKKARLIDSNVISNFGKNLDAFKL